MDLDVWYKHALPLYRRRAPPIDSCKKRHFLLKGQLAQEEVQFFILPIRHGYLAKILGEGEIKLASVHTPGNVHDKSSKRRSMFL